VNKYFKGFGSHLTAILLFTLIALGALAAVSYFAPNIRPSHIGAALYGLAGIALFYVLLKRHKRDRMSREAHPSEPDESASISIIGNDENDSAKERIGETIRKRKAYHKQMSGNNRADR
jgi:hypothetical protein